MTRCASAASCQSYRACKMTTSDSSSNHGAMWIRRVPLGCPLYCCQRTRCASGVSACTGVAMSAPSRAARAAPSSVGAAHASTFWAPPSVTPRTCSGQSGLVWSITVSAPSRCRNSWFCGLAVATTEAPRMRAICTAK